jgi:hypothetical protein
MKTPTKRELLTALRECQGLFGSIEAAYQNDRASNRADRLLPLCKQGFDLCIDILGHFPPEKS